MLTNFLVLKGFFSFQWLQMRSTSNHCVTLIIFFMSSSRKFLFNSPKEFGLCVFPCPISSQANSCNCPFFPIHLNFFQDFGKRKLLLASLFDDCGARWNMAPVLFLLFGSVFHDWRSKWWTRGHVLLLSSRVSRAWNRFKEKTNFPSFSQNVFSFRFLSPIRISRGFFF